MGGKLPGGFMYYNLSDTTSERCAALLEMIERKAPLFMRCGGPLVGEVLDSGRKVSDEERREVVRLREQGWTIAAIAREVGCSGATASRLCMEAGLPQRPRKRLAASLRAEVVALRAKGKKVREIAEAVALPIPTVKMILAQEGVPHRKCAAFGPVEVARLQALRAEGKLAREIAAEMGCKVATVFKWMRVAA